MQNGLKESMNAVQEEFVRSKCEGRDMQSHILFVGQETEGIQDAVEMAGARKNGHMALTGAGYSNSLHSGMCSIHTLSQ